MNARSGGKPVRRPAVRLALFSFAAVAFYSFTLAFFPLYCRDIGYSAMEIAVLSAAGTAATILGTPLSLQLAHSSLSARRLLPALCAASAAIFIILFFTASFSAVALAWFACVLAKRGADSLVDARTVRLSAEGRVRFEHVRLWGSIGFVCAGALIGWSVDRLGSSAIIPSGMINLVLILGTAALAAPLLSSRAARHDPEQGAELHDDDKSFYRPAAALMASNALLWGSTAALYVYLSIYLEELGWSASLISAAWNIGVFAEIAFFIFFPQLERRFSLTGILKFSCAASVVRWLVLAYTTNTALILASQLLHALTFGGCYLASAKLVFLIFPHRLKDRAQGISIAFGQGIGSVCGRLIVGTAAARLDSYTELHLVFLGSAAVAALAYAAAALVKVPQRR